MIFYSSIINARKHRAKINYFVFTKDSWNDYWDFKTLYYLEYIDNNGDKFNIGSVKILDKNQGITELPEFFEELEDNFASLGQELNYYQTLKKYFPEYFEDILSALNDLAFNPPILEDFEDERGLGVSLTRNSEAAKNLKQAQKIINGIDYKSNFNFSYSCLLVGADREHNINFNFDIESTLPNRIISIIGKNGTGKTQYLAKFALDLSGQQKYLKQAGSFEPHRPLFSKIIAVSYSAFDKFTRPAKNKSFSYKYLGLKDQKGFINQKRLAENYQEAIELIEKRNREDDWYNILEHIIPKEILDVFYNELFIQHDYNLIIQEGKALLSSGQSIIIYVITGIIANINNESLVIFDEPEMHLHPNAIANLIRLLHALLDKYNSFAILATHSPIIIQEVPSKFVRILEREGNITTTRTLDIESFGENLTTITTDVFDTNEINGTYKQFFKSISKIYTYEEALDLFEHKLSLNAKIFLNSFYK
ncbi:AAA family ATPase [Luteirhabdus pelagi]|uniref:AAA family ATPase n=1 Tax=Luteirhabdus pelagi TaxID=2792783 RepID=UPI00193A0C21|nr:AAA family ATPase [Luteirhabdus pelagi]